MEYQTKQYLLTHPRAKPANRASPNRSSVRDDEIGGKPPAKEPRLTNLVTPSEYQNEFICQVFLFILKNFLMIKIYNTLSGKKEILKPRKGKKIDFFVCGPTLYDSAHLGHAKTYITFDVIVKYLRHQEYLIFYLQNITDVDDKIIQRAKEQKITPKTLAKIYEKEFFQEMKFLKINSVSKYAKATLHIKEIINQIERLLKKKYAYFTEDGIYFDISRFKNYGKLAKRSILEAERGVSRIDESIQKRNKGDFCLWKYSRSSTSGQAQSEPKWKSPWGFGRPGWHIEDTAICEKYFGFQYDIHGGGQDLIFPHHEAEITQMEAISGRSPMAKYWMHSGFLTVHGEKMSKSLGNFITIKDFLKKEDARVLRFLFVKSHYRSPIDYSEKAILQAKTELEKFDDFVVRLQDTIKAKITQVKKFDILKFKKKFQEAFQDDFNTPKAFGELFNLMKAINTLIAVNKLSSLDAKEILQFLKEIDSFLNVFLFKKAESKIPEEIKKLAQKREQYRKEKNWQMSDEIRKQIEQKKFSIEDTDHGPIIKKNPS